MHQPEYVGLSRPLPPERPSGAAALVAANWAGAAALVASLRHMPRVRDVPSTKPWIASTGKVVFLEYERDRPKLLETRQKGLPLLIQSIEGADVTRKLFLHFATQFRKLTGVSPGEWRRTSGGCMQKN